MIIAITGANGLVGKNLILHLLREGHQVRALVRSPEKILELPKKDVFRWSTDYVPSLESLRGADVVVHLAGENIAAKRWTDQRKAQLAKSRIQGTENLVAAIAQIEPENRPKVLISASAIGFYGSHPETTFDESSPVGTDFLAKLCESWEASCNEISRHQVRVVHMRLGLIFAKDEGFLALAGPAVLGHGRQWMSWVHVQDVCRFVSHAMSNDQIRGPYNLTAPEAVTQKSFTHKLGEILKFPMIFPVPAFAIKLALGELSEAVLSSQKVSPTKTLSSGFEFQFATVDQALRNIYSSMNYLDSRYVCSQFVPGDKSEVFSFFSKAENLETITPPWLNFRILKKSTPSIQMGTLIDYKLKIHGIPVTWRTHIESWNPDESFVDEQLKGPYTKWHHTHTFEKVAGGTLIHDEVIYRVPGSVFGKAALSSWIRKDVNTIFDYRKNKIRELWES